MSYIINSNSFASIACSPNGWTDAELGALWLERIFHPQTKDILEIPDEYRLLILDGHNSHCTVKFLGLAEKHRIIILCLPPHTTHALQPCDVGVFGPLSTLYKKEVANQAKKHARITKFNAIYIYGLARKKAFTEKTICSAFRKCGIWPLNRNVLPEYAFEPARTTSSCSAQPVPASIPRFISINIPPISSK